MPSSVPTPVAAALGIVPTVLDGVRRLPGKAISLPVYALSTTLTTTLSTIEWSRREYDALAERGERLIARLRGLSVDEVEDRVEDALQSTPLAAPYDVLEDALEDAAENVTALVRSVPSTVRKAPDRARKAAGTASASTGRVLERTADTVEEVSSSASRTAKEALDTLEDAAGYAVDTAQDTVGSAVETVRTAAEEVQETGEQVAGTAADVAEDVTADTAADTVASDTEPLADVPAAEAPKGVPTPRATEPDSTRIDTAASSDVVETVERVSAVVGGGVLSHEDLPLPDYDHMTLGSLRGRMRSLDVPQLVQIRDYEKSHANRLPIVTMLDNRIAKLVTDPTAPLSGSKPTDPVPAKASRTRGGSKVDPSTSGPKQNPPSQGDPTNPAQPR